MIKKEIRDIYRAKRKTIAASQKMKWDDLILIRFQQLQLPPIKNVFSFFPMEQENEVETSGITSYLQFINPDLQVAYPVSNFASYTMQAVIVNEETVFGLNKYGIPEPEDNQIMPPEIIDLALIPLLCFDKQGYRVGYGKGFYDRFLTQTNSEIIKIGLSYFEPIDKIADSSNFDVTLNYCVTPEKIYEF